MVGCLVPGPGRHLVPFFSSGIPSARLGRHDSSIPAAMHAVRHTRRCFFSALQSPALPARRLYAGLAEAVRTCRPVPWKEVAEALPGMLENLAAIQREDQDLPKVRAGTRTRRLHPGGLQPWEAGAGCLHSAAPGLWTPSALVRCTACPLTHHAPAPASNPQSVDGFGPVAACRKLLTELSQTLPLVQSLTVSCIRARWAGLEGLPPVADGALESATAPGDH